VPVFPRIVLDRPAPLFIGDLLPAGALQVLPGKPRQLQKRLEIPGGFVGMRVERVADFPDQIAEIFPRLENRRIFDHHRLGPAQKRRRQQMVLQKIKLGAVAVDEKKTEIAVARSDEQIQKLLQGVADQILFVPVQEIAGRDFTLLQIADRFFQSNA